MEEKLNEEKMRNMFEELYDINVTDKVEQKNGLNYLSWAYAWAEVKKRDGNANYKIIMFDNKPYIYDEILGYMVCTEVTIYNQTHQMWLPVMDGANKAMLNHSYTYKVKEYVKGKFTGNYVDKECEKASMFDVNKTLMRCLVKNIAMFGLGLSLYTGEDLPETEVTQEEADKYTLTFGKFKGKTLKEIQEEKPDYITWLLGSTKDERLLRIIELATGEVIPSEEEQTEILEKTTILNNLLNELDIDRDKFYTHYKVKSNAEMNLEQLNDAIEKLRKKAGK